MRRGAVASVVVLVIAPLVGVAGRAAAASPVPTLVRCGVPVTQSIRLLNHMEGCPGSALVVGENGITIDLGGHILIGGGVAGTYGVFNPGFDDVTIRNGSAAGFDTGIRIEGATTGRVHNMVLRGNVEHGMVVDGTSTGVSVSKVTATRNGTNGIDIDGTGNRVSSSHASGNTEVGIAVVTAPDNVIEGNKVIGNGTTGISIDGAPAAPDDNVVRNNRVLANGSVGIALFEAGGSRIVGNTIVGNAANGVLLSNSGSTRIASNRITGNGFDGLTLLGSTASIIEENVVSANDATGIVLDFATEDSFVGRNVAHENGTHGIDIFNADPSHPVNLVRNRTHRNGYFNGTDGTVGLGIRATAGTIGSGNIASGNDDTAECNPSALCQTTGPSPPTLFQCGDLVDADVVLRNNLDCPAGPGVALGTSEVDITIDLGSHRIQTAGAHGVYVTATDVTVRGGVIAGSTVAAARFLSTLGGGRASNLVIADPGAAGIIVETTGIRLSRNTIASPGTSGIVFDFDDTSGSRAISNVVVGAASGIVAQNADAQNILIRANRAIGGSAAGFLIADAGSNIRLVTNRAVGNISDGFRLDNTDDVVLERNLAVANFNGFALTDGADANRLISGSARGNSGHGFTVFNASSRNRINGCRSVSNRLVGVVFAGGTLNNKVVDCVASENGTVGILVNVTQARIFGNAANRNGFIDYADDGASDGGGLGISAFTGVAGTDNTARGNDDTSECVPGYLCP